MTGRRILFVTWAAPGHLFPMVPLAQAFQAAGHDVRVAVPENGVAAALGTGLPAVGVGLDVTMAEKARRPELAEWGRPARWPSGWSNDLDVLPDRQRRVIRALYEKQVAVAEAMLPDLTAFARWWRPDLIVADVLCLAAPVLGAVLGVPVVGHGFEVGSTLATPTAGGNDEPLPEYRELFRRRGVDPVEPVHWIDPCPPSMRMPDGMPVARLDMRCVPFNGVAASPPWLTEEIGRPRICLTAGVAGAKYRDASGPDVLTATVEALAGLDAEVVLAPGGGDWSAPRLPGNVRVVRGVPFRMLLPSCSLVVHHGGAGTALTAVECAVPQVVVPPAPICSEIGDRVERAGVGRMLDPDDGPDALRDTVEGLLADAETAESLSRLAKEIAALPAPTAVAGALAGGLP